jgi:hypothetical protein
MEQHHNSRAPQSNREDVKIKESPDVSRRSILRGVGGAALFGLTGAFVYKYQSSQKKQEPIKPIKEKEIIPEDPRALLFKRAKEAIQAKITQLEKDPTVSRTKRARDALVNTLLPDDGEGIALSFSCEGGQNESIAIPSVTDMRRNLYDPKHRRYDVVSGTGDTRRKFSLSISDIAKDIGVSSRLSVVETTGGSTRIASVLAVKRARYIQEEGRYGEYVTYTPAHKDIRTPEVISLGKQYVDTVVEEAFNLFSHKSVNKEALNLSAEVARRVAIVEHIDPYEFHRKNKERGEIKSLYDIAFAEHALNPGFAYNHLINGVGAGGMMQIIPKTYRDVRDQIIKRGLFRKEDIPDDVDKGRKDPLVSAIISIALCYLNYDFATSSKEVSSVFRTAPHEDKLLMLASMYNGSPNLLRRIMKDESTPNVLRPNKKKKEGDTPKQKRSVREKLLSNGKGNTLAGAEETENENYIKKFILYKSLS